MRPLVVSFELYPSLWADFWSLAHGLAIYVNDHPSERGIATIEGVSAMRQLVRAAKAVGYEKLLSLFRFARDEGGRSEQSEFQFITQRNAHQHEWSFLGGKVLDRVDREIRKAERERKIWLKWSAGPLGQYEDSAKHISLVDYHIKSLKKQRNLTYCKHSGLSAPEKEAA